MALKSEDSKFWTTFFFLDLPTERHTIPEDECGSNLPTFFIQLKETTEKPQPENLPDRGSNQGPLLER